MGRGDRRLSAVVRRAWELGAGMDAWWESTEQAYLAWTQAINESGLTWQYRQVESGEGHVFGENTASFLDAPLPWDHIDTGIDKQWLKEDLHKALAAAIVPDCSFEGCSHCGVCGVDFGHNIVFPSPEIPAFTGQSTPNQNRMQRIRVRFGKEGDLALVGHLDLVRLFDRMIRRAALPIAFTGGFHPGPRISLANALALGATSSGEIVDFELTQPLDVPEFESRLRAQLPVGMPLYEVEEVPLDSPAASRLLTKAEYLLTLTTTGEISSDIWQDWIRQVLASSEIGREKTSKSGKVAVINLRDRLFALELVEITGESARVRYVGSCCHDGTILQPQQVVFMLQRMTTVEIHLDSIHRQGLILV